MEVGGALTFSYQLNVRPFGRYKFNFTLQVSVQKTITFLLQINRLITLEVTCR